MKNVIITWLHSCCLSFIYMMLLLVCSATFILGIFLEEMFQNSAVVVVSYIFFVFSGICLAVIIIFYGLNGGTNNEVNK